MNDAERKAYYARFGSQDNVFRIVRHPADIVGIGTEYLMAGRSIYAKYVNGKRVKEYPIKIRKAS